MPTIEESLFLLFAVRKTSAWFSLVVKTIKRRIMYLVYFIIIPFVVWGIIYHFKHTRIVAEDLGHPGVLSLGSFNGFGETLLGGFKTANVRGEVYYAMFTIIFLPICPIKCIVASLKDSHSFLIGWTSNYEVFYKTTSYRKEILSIYVVRWGIAILFINTIVLLG